MFHQSVTRLNRMAFVGYHLDTRIGTRTLLRVDIPEVSMRRADMDVSGLGSVQGGSPLRTSSPVTSSSPVNSTSANQVGAANTPSIAVPQDELEISAAGKMLERLSESPEARAERIAQIKQAIDDGDFDTDAKLEAALERMFEIHGFDLGDE